MATEKWNDDNSTTLTEVPTWPLTPDQIAYFAGRVRARTCLHDFAANGACIRPKGHDEYHQDANGYAWTNEESPKYLGRRPRLSRVNTEGQIVEAQR